MPRTSFVRIWDPFGLLAIVLASWIVFAAFTEGFVSDFNIFSVGRLVSIAVVVGFSQMVVIGIGQMNLSVGAIGGVVAMFLGWLVQAIGVPWPLAILLAVAFGGVLGGLNGVVIVRTGINAFIVTLGTGQRVHRGHVHPDQGRGLPGPAARLHRVRAEPASRLRLAAGDHDARRPGLPLPALPRHDARSADAGDRRERPGGARVSGVPVDRIITVTHMLSGALAGLAGVMLVLRIGSAIPSIGTAGGGDWLLPSFAAPAIGGTLLSGGVINRRRDVHRRPAPRARSRTG